MQWRSGRVVLFRFTMAGFITAAAACFFVTTMLCDIFQLLPFFRQIPLPCFHTQRTKRIDA